MVVAISTLSPWHLQFPQQLPQRPTASLTAFYLKALYAHTSFLCSCTLEERCRLEGLEINTLQDLHSTNDRRELGENPDPTPPFDKSWACVLNRFPEFFSSTKSICSQPCLACNLC